MKHLLIALMIISLCTFSLYAVDEETASFKNFLYGTEPACSYDNWHTHIAEGIASVNYNLYAEFDRQMNNFGDFEIPTSAELSDWSDIVDQFVAGELDAAQALIDEAGFPYEVIIFHDTDYDRTYHIMREIPNMLYVDNNNTDDPNDDENGAFEYGWGLFVRNIDSPYPHIITTPHPNDDYFTVQIGYKAFVDQQARYMLIMGAGREVAWTEQAPYYNSKSLSDPTRVQNHPYNTCYKAFCDEIRETFEHREFSLQFHSYDWGGRHTGYPNVQISGGQNVYSPDLPIRDHSGAKNDVINNTSHVVHPANSIGIHGPVYLNEFYGVHYSVYDFTYNDGENIYPVNNVIDLWGYRLNRQMQYTNAGLNHYDNWERFFHVEFDELPEIYPQVNNVYKWFWGWDPVTETWDMEHRYDKVLEFYSPFIDALTETLIPMFEMNDNQTPEAPENLRVVTEAVDYIELEWDGGDAYDMYSYEVLYDTEPIDNGNYEIHDRINNYRLACLSHRKTAVINLDESETYYFKVRVKDKNDNVSELSNEVTGLTGSANIDDFEAFGRNGYVELNWIAEEQNSNQGFNIYRKLDDGDFEEIASWETDESLEGSNQEDVHYSFVDTTVVNGQMYTYQLASETSSDLFYIGDLALASPQMVFELRAQTDGGFYSDIVYYGMNPYASDGYESDFDYSTTDGTSGQYFFTQFYEADWSDPTPKQFSQQIEGPFDPEHSYKSWRFRLRTNQLGQQVEIELLNPLRDAERMVLIRGTDITDLTTESAFITPTSSSTFYYYNLYWGNLTPSISFSSMDNQLYQPGDNVTFEWDCNLVGLIDHVNVYAYSDEASIEIDSDIVPAGEHSVSWTVPEQYYENMKFKVELIMKEGDTLEYLSPYSFGIAPLDFTYVSNQGWSLITKTLGNDDYTDQEIYGDGAIFYELLMGFYSVSSEATLGRSYWLNAQADHTFNSTNSEIEKEEYDYDLYQGWNVIPNPHKATYSIDQLKVKYDNTTYQFTEAVQQGLVAAMVFDYDDSFSPVVELDMDKAYFLYCYEDDVELIYTPYFANHQNSEHDFNWIVELTASQVNGMESKIVTGLSPVTDSLYDPLYDLLKPNVMPMEEYTLLSIQHDFDGGEMMDYHQSFTGRSFVGQDEIYSWDLKLELVNTDDVTFSVEEIDLNPAYYVLLNIDGEFILLDQDYIFTPDETTETLQLYVSTIDLAVGDNHQLAMVGKKFGASNFPNPFNPKTVINYDIPENGDVELTLYNIRGQKVKTLVKEYHEAGSFEIIWDGTNSTNNPVGSGVYFYKLSSESREPYVGKMILMK